MVWLLKEVVLWSFQCFDSHRRIKGECLGRSATRLNVHCWDFWLSLVPITPLSEQSIRRSNFTKCTRSIPPGSQCRLLFDTQVGQTVFGSFRRVHLKLCCKSMFTTSFAFNIIAVFANSLKEHLLRSFNRFRRWVCCLHVSVMSSKWNHIPAFSFTRDFQ